MPAALPKPSFGGLLTQWSFEPIAVVAAVALAFWYFRAVRATDAWPIRRSIGFAAGLVLLVWSACGFLEVYRRAQFWVWTTQALVLWLAVPLVLLAGRPVHLAMQRSGPDSRLMRALRSPVCKVLANPLVGPALVPLLSAVLFFGPLPGWATDSDAVAWLLQTLLVVIGALILLPLVGLDDGSSSLAVGLSLAIGMFELVLDAVPGIVLRLNTHVTTSYFAHADKHPWTLGRLHDQHVAGSIVWIIAEVIDLPFLLLVFRRWVRVDAREAAAVDAILDAERIARGEPAANEDETARDAPWWLTDPAMQQRFKRGG